MTKIRRRRPRFEFVQILNAVARDYRVSWRARGLLTELLSYPEDYETSVDELVKKAKPSGGNMRLRGHARLLANCDVGYIVVRRYQNEHGIWSLRTSHRRPIRPHMGDGSFRRSDRRRVFGRRFTGRRFLGR